MATSRQKPTALGRKKGRFTQHRGIDRMRRILEAHPTGLPLRSLANELRITTRSVRRYLEELDRDQEIESMGTVPGGPHLWRIKPSEKGRAVQLRRTQSYALLAAKDVFQPLAGSALAEELDLAHAQLLQTAHRPTRANQRGELSPASRLEKRFKYIPIPSAKYKERGDDIDELFGAVAEYRVITFLLRPSFTRELREAGRITFHPYGLILHRGRVHLVGYDVSAKREDTFTLDEIHSIADTGKTFTLAANFELAPFVHGEFGVMAPARTLPRVVIEFDPSLADEVRQRPIHPTQRLGTAPDGRVRLSLEVPDWRPVLRWMLGFGHRAKAIEPPEFVEQVRAEVKRTADRYPKR